MGTPGSHRLHSLTAFFKLTHFRNFWPHFISFYLWFIILNTSKIENNANKLYRVDVLYAFFDISMQLTQFDFDTVNIVDIVDTIDTVDRDLKITLESEKYSKKSRI